MIKLNLSNPYDLLQYRSDLNKLNLYLGYVKGSGYILIQENNDNAFFKIIESDKDPSYLNDNWHNPTYKDNKWEDDEKEISIIYTELDKILKGYIKKTLAGNQSDYFNKIVNGVFVEVVADLLESLSFKFESYDYIKPKDISNSKIKDLALNPVEQFNFYLNYGGEPLSKGEYSYQKKEVFNKLESTLQEAVNLFNDKKGITGYNKKGNESPLITESSFIKLFNEIIDGAFGNPLINLRYGNGREKSNQIASIDYLTEEFNIKGIYKNGAESIYYFNDELNYFEPLTVQVLKNLIIKKLGIKLVSSDYNTIFKSFETNSKLYDNILVFRNMLFDMDYMEELNFPLCNYDRTEYLAPSLIGYEDKNNKVQLLDYDMDIDFLEIYNPKVDQENITFVEKTLRQILIPKDNPTDLKMFHDFLQRLGSCILGKNKYKVITLYYGDGNNGKGILKLLFELIYNKGAYPLTPSNFNDSFGAKGFLNKKVLLLDEIDKDDFKDMKPTLKRISSPVSKLQQRAMHSQEYITLSNFPMLFIFSNVLVKLNISEKALFDRFDFLKLPNTFVSESELNKTANSYLKDRNTEIKIMNDIKGLTWLVTASIKAFKNMESSNTEFILKQTAEETMDILLDTDYLTKFITLFTYEDENLIPSEFTTVEEIYQQYEQYMELQGKTITESEIAIKRKIGTTIKKVYDISGKVTDSEMYHKRNNRISTYRIKLKSFDEINKEFKQVYTINEDVTAEDLMAVSYANDNQIVYDKIQNGVNTINLLNMALPGYDIPKIIRELSNLKLIVKTTDTNLNNDK